MTKKLLGLLMCLVLIISFSGCRQKSEIYIDTQESFYSDFFVSNNKVYIKCILTINNTTEDDVNASFIGYFYEDVKTGLLKNAELKGYEDDFETSSFSIPKGKHNLTVTFIGEFAGNNQKSNRQLPDIRIINNGRLY